MSVIDQLEALFPGRGALAAGILRNHGIWIETHDLEPAPSAAPEPSEPEPEAQP